MTAGLDEIARRCSTPADAVRWACVLEATAPKAGNVSPGNNFPDLTYVDFVTAAEITAAEITAGDSEGNHASPASADPDPSFALWVNAAAREVARSLGTNVNLGILLLLGPLVQADAAGPAGGATRNALHVGAQKSLASLGRRDSALLYSAINAASPGGMGRRDDMDLSGPAPDDFLEAMRCAAEHDRIAKNYATGFNDFFGVVLPLVQSALDRESDLLAGLALAHLRLLAAEPDSLIIRKFGPELARAIQKEANFDHDDRERRHAFERRLRAGARDLRGKHIVINPGTTADLIAAALYVLLREART